MPKTRLMNWSGIFLLPLSLIFSDQGSDHDLLDLKKTVEKEYQLIDSLRMQIEAEATARHSLISDLENEVAQQQTTIDDLQSQVNDMGMTSQIDPCDCIPDIYSYRPNLGERWGFLTGELLYWKTLEDASDYAITNVPNTSYVTGPTGPIISAKFGWDPGFRFTMGYHFQPDGWDLKAVYTYIKNKAADKLKGTNSIDDPLLIATYTTDNVPPLALAKNNIELVYQVFELLTEKKILVDDGMILALFSGLTAGSLGQSNLVTYKCTASYSFITNDQNFNGFGLKLGASTDCHFGYGFGLDGMLAFSALGGKYNYEQKNLVYPIASSSDGTIIEDVRLNQSRALFGAQFKLGPNWGINYANWGVKAFIGYEMNAWFNFQEIYNFSDSGNNTLYRAVRPFSGVVCLQGITANFSFNF